MSSLYTIYKATNKINNKAYIGFASKWPNRKYCHRSLSRNGTKVKFYNAIRKYGWDSFVWEVLYQNTDKEHTLNTMESFYITKHDTINNGYNMTPGGAGVLGICKDTVWVNNGTNHKRIMKTDPIPVGYVIGRLHITRKIKMSDEQKTSQSQKMKNRYNMGDNPAARRVLYNGKEYSCLKEASIKNNISTYFIQKNGTLI